MPHMLVAGITRSGKRTFLRTLACSIILKASPSQVGLVLIDCKRVDFSCFAGAPHLMALEGPGHVIKEPHEEAKTIRTLNSLMDARYRAIESKAAIPGPECIVVIIDELADLLWQTNDPDAEHNLERLAALGGAAGIHIIVGTQRPSHDLISTRLRASLDARAAFRVSNGKESNLILDGTGRDGAPGAERLVGAGEMIIRLPGQPTERLQAAFAGAEEVERIIEAPKKIQTITAHKRIS